MQLSFIDILFPRRAAARVTKKRVRRVRKSDPELHQLWCSIRQQWFPDRPDLDAYQVYWSTRAQKRTLASCNIESKRVSVARELAPAEHRRWLHPLLYHEMCHAYLGLSVFSETERSRWHGPEFKSLENRHPEMQAFDYWVKNGGWSRAVRSDRAKRAYRRQLTSA